MIPFLQSANRKELSNWPRPGQSVGASCPCLRRVRLWAGSSPQTLRRLLSSNRLPARPHLRLEGSRMWCDRFLWARFGRPAVRWCRWTFHSTSGQRTQLSCDLWKMYVVIKVRSSQSLTHENAFKVMYTAVYLSICRVSSKFEACWDYFLWVGTGLFILHFFWVW